MTEQAETCSCGNSRCRRYPATGELLWTYCDDWNGEAEGAWVSYEYKHCPDCGDRLFFNADGTPRIERRAGLVPKEQLEAVRGAAYVEDCDVTGFHDPEHTSKRRSICDLQLATLALRVCNVLFGVNAEGLERARDEKMDLADFRELYVQEMNKIPRRLDRDGWYKYYAENGYLEKAAQLEAWETDGLLVLAAAQAEQEQKS